MRAPPLCVRMPCSHALHPQTLLERCQPFHLITPADGMEARLCKGGLVPVEITVKKVQGRKWMTYVKNLELFGIQAEEFRALATKKFACSCSLQEVPGSRNHFVLIQGNLASSVMDFLVTGMGMKQHFVAQKG